MRCILCKRDAGTTEHVIICEKTENNDLNIYTSSSDNSHVLKKLCDHVLQGLHLQNKPKI